MLPKALLPIELVYDGSALELRIGDPVSVGDLAHTYTLQRSGNVFTSDNVTISVDSATGLLSAIDVKSDDKTLPVIAKLVSGLRAEAADAMKAVVVFRGLFDPGVSQEEEKQFNELLNRTAVAHVERLAIENECKSGATSDPCKGINNLRSELAAATFAVKVDGGAGASRPPADCAAGFCYRLNVPHVVTLSGPGTSSSAVFGLPNRSPTFVMPLERWAFVKTTHDVKLEKGVFKSIASERPSSALAVASAPLDVAKGVLGAAAEVLQLKIDLSGKEKALADAKVAELKSKEALEKELLSKLEGGKAEAALLGRAAEGRGPLLSIRVGQPSQLDATKNLIGNKPPAIPSGLPNANPNPVPGGKTSPGSSGGIVDREK